MPRALSCFMSAFCPRPSAPKRCVRATGLRCGFFKGVGVCRAVLPRSCSRGSRVHHRINCDLAGELQLQCFIHPGCRIFSALPGRVSHLPLGRPEPTGFLSRLLQGFGLGLLAMLRFLLGRQQALHQLLICG